MVTEMASIRSVTCRRWPSRSVSGPPHLEISSGRRPGGPATASPGHGLPVLFMHGWAVGRHAYKRALNRLVRLGCQVYAPALPGFGGSASPCPGEDCDLGGYAAWLDAFLEPGRGRRAGVRDRPQLRRCRGDQAGPRFPRSGRLAGADQLRRRRDLVDRPATRCGPWRSGRCGTGPSIFPPTSSPAPRVYPRSRAILEDAIPNIVSNPRRPVAGGQPGPPGRPDRRSGRPQSPAACRYWCCGARATASSRGPASRPCAPRWARPARSCPGGTPGCWPIRTGSGR